jgi:hypothetical protein
MGFPCLFYPILFAFRSGFVDDGDGTVVLLRFARSASSFVYVLFKEFGESFDDVGVFLVQVLFFADVAG